MKDAGDEIQLRVSLHLWLLGQQREQERGGKKMFWKRGLYPEGTGEEEETMFCQSHLLLVTDVGPLHLPQLRASSPFLWMAPAAPCPLRPPQSSLHSGQQRTCLPRAEFLSIGPSDVWGWTTLFLVDVWCFIDP